MTKNRKRPNELYHVTSRRYMEIPLPNSEAPGGPHDLKTTCTRPALIVYLYDQQLYRTTAVFLSPLPGRRDDICVGAHYGIAR